MPDQPADPLHYEMKIPPEPAEKHEEEAEQASGDGSERQGREAERDKESQKNP